MEGQVLLGATAHGPKSSRGPLVDDMLICVV